MRFRTSLLTFVALSAFVIGFQPPVRKSPAPEPESEQKQFQGPIQPKEETEFHFVSTADDAVAWASMDVEELLKVNSTCLPYIRYIWIRDGDPVSRKVMSLVINFVSRASAIRKLPGVPFALGPPVKDPNDRKAYLLRVDLRWFAPQYHLKDWVKFWEEFGFDPSLAKLVTKDNLAFLSAEQKLAIRRTITIPAVYEEVDEQEDRGYWLIGNRQVERGTPGAVWFHTRFVPTGKKIKQLKSPERTEEVIGLNQDVNVIRFNPGHIDFQRFQALQQVTSSIAPVVEARYFLFRALSTIKQTGQDKKVFADVWGGLYYELEGGARLAKDVQGKDTKVTDLDQFLADMGVGNIKGDLKAEDFFNEKNGDLRIAILISKITGKAREATGFHILTTPRHGWGSITGDIDDEDVDVGDLSYANLLNPRRAAREALFPKQNGLTRQALFNGKGVRQDRVPPTVAADRTIPSPNTMELQGLIGCLRCHGPHNMWQPAKNDAKSLLTATKADIFDDLTGKGFQDQNIDRLASWFRGNFEDNLKDARNLFASSVLEATGPWKNAPLADVGIVASAEISRQYGEYWYEPVSAKTVLFDMGIIAPVGTEVEVLKYLVPPDLRQYIGGIFLEDPRLIAPQAGLQVRRSNWALIQSFVTERAQPRILELKKREMK